MSKPKNGKRISSRSRLMEQDVSLARRSGSSAFSVPKPRRVGDSPREPERALARRCVSQVEPLGQARAGFLVLAAALPGAVVSGPS